MQEEQDRALNYYLKGLSIEVKQKIFDKFRNDINAVMIKQLLEKEEGYTSFKMAGYTDENIAQVAEMYSHKFEGINEIMEENDREPLFSDPSDSYKSSLEYVDIFSLKTKEELVARFGTDLDSYEPKVLKKTLEKADREEK